MATPSKGLQDYLPKMSLDGLHLHKCAGVPDDALSGHPKGCLVVDTTNGALYINTGTASSTTYNNVQAIAASEITLATGSILVGTAGVGAALDAKTSGRILVGDGTTLASVAVSGDATLSSAGALTIAANAVSLAKFARSDAAGKFVVGQGASADAQYATMSGDASMDGSGAVTVTDLTLGSDAAGDMFYKTSATVTARLAKGTANQMLHMNSGATAPEWVSPLAGLVETSSATATADGLTTGNINALTGLKKFVTVTSANATDAITLPGINVGTVGQEIFLTVGANGYELLTPASSNNTINQVDSDGTNQLDVAANTTVRCTQVSSTGWLVEQIAATAITVVAPDND